MNSIGWVIQFRCFNLCYRLFQSFFVMQAAADGFSNKESWKIKYTKEKTIDLRNKYLGSALEIFFRDDPLKIVKGKYQYLFDENDNQYLDCINNVSHVGHCHPYILSACMQQMTLLNTNSRFLHDNVVNLAARLASLIPSSVEVCFFVNSGSEANDLAMRLGRYYTRSKQTLVLEHAYHGNLISNTQISPYKLDKKNCEEIKPKWCHVIPIPDMYRGKYRNSDYTEDELTNLYAEEVEKTCQSIENEGKSVGMFFLESLQSCGGQVIFPKGYLKKVYNIIHNHGGILIVDEVQTGFGRVGETFWAFQLGNCDIIPDILTMGKPMGNGFPIAAVITKREISEAFNRGPNYFNTYGGNPVSCAAALAVLDVIEKEKLQENAKNVGTYIYNQLLLMMHDFYIIGDVRGSGFIIGIDLVLNRKTREPATLQTSAVLKKLRKRLIIMSCDGPYNNILKFKPPMCFTENDANFLIDNLKIVFKEVQEEMPIEID